MSEFATYIVDYFVFFWGTIIQKIQEPEAQISTFAFCGCLFLLTYHFLFTLCVKTFDFIVRLFNKGE